MAVVAGGLAVAGSLPLPLWCTGRGNGLCPGVHLIGQLGEILKLYVGVLLGSFQDVGRGLAQSSRHGHEYCNDTAQPMRLAMHLCGEFRPCHAPSFGAPGALLGCSAVIATARHASAIASAR